MKSITLVTHNQNKVREFKSILEPEVSVIHVDLEYPELRSDESQEVACLSARQLADTLAKPIVVEDSGLFIEALLGFPGTCSAYIHKRIGLPGLLKLMKGIRKRNCFYKSAIAYCAPGEKPYVFIGVEYGRISQKALGNYGWGHDPLFIPKGAKKTYGQLKKNWVGPSKFRKDALQKLKAFLERQIVP